MIKSIKVRLDQKCNGEYRNNFVNLLDDISSAITKLDEKWKHFNKADSILMSCFNRAECDEEGGKMQHGVMISYCLQSNDGWILNDECQQPT